MKVFPGWSFASMYLMPLKKTSSIWALSSAIMTLSLLTALNLASEGSTALPLLSRTVADKTLARTWMYALSVRISAMGMIVLRSMYLYGYVLMRSLTVFIPNSDSRRRALFGPTPLRNCISGLSSVCIVNLFNLRPSRALRSVVFWCSYLHFSCFQLVVCRSMLVNVDCGIYCGNH